MTSVTSRSNPRRGFSLVELLVVIGIILVLAGIALPILIKAYSQAEKSKARADLNTIAVCLEAYKQDYGDYPRPGINAATGYPIANLGAATLCKALVGPGDALPTTTAWAGSTVYSPGQVVVNGGVHYICVETIPTSGGNAYITPAATSPATNYWAVFSDGDGLNGPGWRPRLGAKPQAAYLQMDRFKLKGMMLTNKDGHVILYYPAATSSPRIDKRPGQATAAPDPTGGFYGGYCGPNPTSIGRPLPLYNASDNLTYLLDHQLQVMLGDFSANGAIDAAVSTEVAYANEPFLLITPGPDGVYGPTGLDNDATTMSDWTKNKAAAAACDDVTNFQK